MKKRKVAVPRAWQNKFTRINIILTLVFLQAFAETSLAVPSKLANQDDLTELTLKVFPETPKSRTCLALSKKASQVKSENNKNKTQQFTSSYSYIDDGLNTLIENLVEGINNKDHFALKKLFHPRLAISTGAVKQVMIKIEGNLSEDIEASPENLWALYNKEGTASFIECPNDQIKISPLYGYDLQFGLWISILGPRNIGKVYVDIVPSNGHFYIGAFHFQMWTHNGKDFMGWVKEADTDYKNKKYMAAFIKYDIAKKLIFGKTFYKLSYEDKIDSFLKNNLDQKVWEQNILDSLPKDKIIFAGSILSTGGAGLQLRFSIPKEWSAHAIREHCKGVYTTLSKKEWFNTLDGVRCGYNLPWEKDSSKDGVLGSIFVDADSFKKRR